MSRDVYGWSTPIHDIRSGQKPRPARQCTLCGADPTLEYPETTRATMLARLHTPSLLFSFNFNVVQRIHTQHRPRPV